MADITAGMVKDLREKTGAGMMDCKRALTENAGNMEEAVDWLRKKGLAAAAKRSARVAAEGLVGAASAPGVAAIVEVNSETDFVARNDQFQAFVEALAQLVLTHGDDVEALKGVQYLDSATTVGEHLTNLVATIGENISIRRAKRISVPGGTVATYVHSAVRPGLGKIGVLVGVQGGEAQIVETLGRQMGMHIAASRPMALEIAGVDPAALEREKAILIDQAKQSGRPDHIIEKMVEGRIRKFYEEVVLLEQVWVHDGESRVQAVLKKAGVTLVGFERFQVGEGVDKPQGPDFAAEVAATAGS